MALGGKMIDLIRLNIVDKITQLPTVIQVSVMEEELLARDVRIAVDVIDPVGVEGARSPDQSMDFTPFGKKQLGQIRTILSGNAGNQGAFHDTSR
jgi:hypothetical protein